MTRFHVAVATALALLAAPVLAQAEARRDAGEVSIAYSPDRLATVAGRETLKAEIAAVADAYCRSHPVGGTVVACRADVTAELTKGLELRAQAYAKANPQVQLAGR